MKHEVTSFNTKKSFSESLKKIMKKKSFSKITVNEIITDCGVNRKTFYYHFSDIYDLLKWTFEKEAVEVVKHFNLMVDYEKTILFVMDYVEQNEYIINCAYDAIGRDGMKRFFFTDFTEIIYTLITSAEKELDKTLDEEYKNFLCTFYTEALVGILIDWMKNRNKYSKEQIVAYIVSTIRSSLKGILH